MPRPRGNSGGDTPPSVITTPKADIPRKQRVKAGREQPTDFKHWKVLQQNVGGAFNAKGLVLTQSAEGFDIICVQEVGEVSEVPSQQPFPGYVTFVASTGRAQEAGVAILIKQELARYVRGEPYRDAGGRLICITLKGFSKTHQQTLMIASVYMPTGLDNRTTRSPEHAVAKQLHQLVREKVAQHSLAIVAGDFNETLTKADRSVNGKNNSFALMKLTASVMTDTFRALHPLALAKEAHTNVTTRLDVTTTARLDYVLTKSSAIAGQECLTPVDARVGGELISSTHLPLIITMKIAMQQPSPPPQPRPALRTARVSQEEIQDFVDTVAEKLLTKKPGPTNFADSLWALNETVFSTGADIVGKKGKRTPTKHSKKDTRTGRLRQQLVALDMAGALLQSQSQAAKHWPLFENHFQPKLPAEIDVVLNDAQNDPDREQKAR